MRSLGGWVMGTDDVSIEFTLYTHSEFPADYDVRMYIRNAATTDGD